MAESLNSWATLIDLKEGVHNNMKEKIAVTLTATWTEYNPEATQ